MRRARGDNPDELPLRYARLINAAIARRPRDMKVCVHLCRGNFRSSWVAEGGYEPVARVLFNELEVDGYFLEYDDARSGDFTPLRHVPRDKMVVLGLISTKLDKLESADELRRRIDQASRHLPLEQMCLSPQCGFSSTVHGNDLAVEMQGKKLQLVVDIARAVWGYS
jgi:5-methyltetrahydropteroyltriglutamate--homocysteine methyltransferase